MVSSICKNCEVLDGQLTIIPAKEASQTGENGWMHNVLPVCTTEDSWYLQEKFLANIHYKGFSIEMRTKVPLERSQRI